MAIPEQRPERELVERCLAGDAAAWEAFVRGYSPPAERAVRSLLIRFGYPADPARVQEWTQEVMASFADRTAGPFTRFKWSCSLAGYVSGVAARHVVPRLRDRQAGWENRRIVPLLGDVLSKELPPQAGLDRADMRGKVNEALSRLPEAERLALQFFYWDGVAPEGIARALGVSRAAAWKLLSRARQRLHPLLKSLICMVL